MRFLFSVINKVIPKSDNGVPTYAWMKEYNLKRPNEDDFEYSMIEVANGVSRLQLNDTSLRNYANADRITTLVNQTLSRCDADADNGAGIQYRLIEIGLLQDRGNSKDERQATSSQLGQISLLGRLLSKRGE